MTVFVAGETEKEAISKIFNHLKVYDMISDDMSPDVFEPMPESALHIINDALTGVVRLDAFNGVCCSVHIATLPELWGKARGFVNEVMNFCFKRTRFVSGVAIVPDYNKLVKKLCIDCGFEKQGVLEKSFLKNWKYHDQTIYGISKYKRRAICQQ